MALPVLKNAVYAPENVEVPNPPFDTGNTPVTVEAVLSTAPVANLAEVIAVNSILPAVTVVLAKSAVLRLLSKNAAPERFFNV
jgi:hypothetical protein